jgi:hypothetical protein
MFENFLDDLLAVDSVGFGLKSHENTMAKDIVSDGFDILGSDEAPLP